jgi:hypothetical protein
MAQVVSYLGGLGQNDGFLAEAFQHYRASHLGYRGF